MYGTLSWKFSVVGVVEQDVSDSISARKNDKNDCHFIFL